jgi:hypothetical protein
MIVLGLRRAIAVMFAQFEASLTSWGYYKTMSSQLCRLASFGNEEMIVY